ncbi:hypothetical protein RRG08_033739 [Elysia crispata]|uniref:Uncharacterized protein n=1 Tax=Elysia crispata TaxID=231223 RepID=A0AAE1DUR2_9GAST|nr:hypothetical protein RRG08_033739 [Elysia crispata]
MDLGLRRLTSASIRWGDSERFRYTPQQLRTGHCNIHLGSALGPDNLIPPDLVRHFGVSGIPKNAAPLRCRSSHKSLGDFDIKRGRRNVTFSGAKRSDATKEDGVLSQLGTRFSSLRLAMGEVYSLAGENREGIGSEFGYECSRCKHSPTASARFKKS